MVSQELYDHWDSKIRHLKPTVENLMRHEIELQANLKIPNTCSNDEFGCYLIPEAFISELFREYNKKISEYRKPATAF
jgi:hypothetical protein